uniref:hypothetical protein n=1 Tax=Prevotella sp. TaxID=59823 RepID=UPI00402857EB
MTDFLYKTLQFIVFVHKDAYIFQDFLLYGNSTGSPHLPTKPLSSDIEAAFICQQSLLRLPTKPIAFAIEAYCVFRPIYLIEL